MVSSKHVFWQALLVTILIFALGFILGVYLEQIRSDRSNVLLYESETDLFDTLTFTDLFESHELSCEEMTSMNLRFADKIYTEAQVLEKYDEASKVVDSLKAIHRKYDLLRTVLWINSIKLQEKCNTNNVVYFYEYNTDDLIKRSKQITFSRVLEDLKQERGEDFVLIPIAVNMEINSLDYLLEYYNVSKFPAVLINGETLVTEVSSVEELEGYLK